MRSVNKVILLGHLGKDAEARFTPKGTQVASFSVATSGPYPEESKTLTCSKCGKRTEVQWFEGPNAFEQWKRYVTSKALRSLRNPPRVSPTPARLSGTPA